MNARLQAELHGKHNSSSSTRRIAGRNGPRPKQGGAFDHNKALTGPDLIDSVDGELFPYLRGFKGRAEHADTIEYKIGEIFGEIKNKFQSGYNLREAINKIDELRFRTYRKA